MSHPQRYEESRPEGKPTLVRLKNGGMALVKTVEGKRVIIRRYPNRRPTPAEVKAEVPVVEVTPPPVQQLPLAPLTQEAAEKLGDRAAIAFSQGFHELGSLLKNISTRLEGTEEISKAQIDVLAQVARSLEVQSDRSNQLMERLSDLPQILEGMRSTLEKQHESSQRSEHTLSEFRSTMAGINDAIAELTRQQAAAVEGMLSQQGEAIEKLSSGHLEAVSRIVEQQGSSVRELSEQQSRAVENLVQGQRESLRELTREQAETLRETNRGQVEAFERTHERAMTSFGEAQAENVGAFAKAQAEQAAAMGEMLRRSRATDRVLIAALVLVVLLLVALLLALS